MSNDALTSKLPMALQGTKPTNNAEGGANFPYSAKNGAVGSRPNQVGTLNRAKKRAQAEFDAKIVRFMTENPEEPHRKVAQWFGVHRNYVGRLSRNILGPRKRGRKLRGSSRG